MKKNFTKTLTIICSAVAMTATAKTMDSNLCNKPPLKPQYNPTDTPTKVCVCGSGLENIKLALKTPFALKAACNLGWKAANGFKPIKLQREKITLDQYTNGDFPDGMVLFTGTATIKGILSFRDSPAGNWWFSFDGKTIANKQPMSDLLGSMRLTPDPDIQKLRIPKKLKDSDCFELDATISITDIWKTFGDTDEAGAFPVRYKILETKNARNCK